MDVIRSLLNEALGSASSISRSAQRVKEQVAERRAQDARLHEWNRRLMGEMERLCSKVSELQELRDQAAELTHNLEATREALTRCQEVGRSGNADVDYEALEADMDQLRADLAAGAKILEDVVSDHDVLLQEALNHESALKTDIAAFERRCGADYNLDLTPNIL